METTFEDLMDQAYDLPQGRAKIQVLEEAIKLADSMGDIDAGYEARSELVEACSFNGYPMKALIAFSWQLGQFDRDPERFYYYDLFWSYKWVLDKLPCFPEINLSQINELLEDMGKRYREYGYSDRTYYYYHLCIAMELGEMETATKYMKLVQEMAPDDMSDCSACEQDLFVQYQIMLGNDEQALKTAEPILKGRLTCGEVPHVTLTQVLLPLYRLGRLDEAKKYYQQGYRLVKGNRDFLKGHGEMIAYLTLVDPILGLEVFEEHAPLSVDHENPLDQMLFYGTAAALFKRLTQEDVNFQVKLPSDYPHPEEATDVSKLAQRYLDMALNMAQKFDARNGNSYYTNLINKM